MRKIMRNLMKSLGPFEMETSSRELSAQLFRFLFQQDQTYPLVGGFASLPDEVQWILEFHDDIDRLCFPKVDSLGMSFVRCRPDEITYQHWGAMLIPTPPEKELQTVVPPIMVIPGLAFGKKGERLGRGKGYYDRYLADYKGIKVGVALEIQIRNDIPMDEFDVYMNYVITDKHIYQCCR